MRPQIQTLVQAKKVNKKKKVTKYNSTEGLWTGRQADSAVGKAVSLVSIIF
jgi:hypothetical protein